MSVQEAAVVTEAIPDGLTATPPADVTPESAAPVDEAAAPTEEAPPPPAWATVYDPTDLVDHPDVKPLIDRRIARREAEIQQASEQTVQQRTRNWEATQIAQTIAGIRGPLEEKITAMEDVPGAERLLDKLRKIAEPYDNEVQGAIKDEGFTDGTRVQFNMVRGAIMEALDEKGKDAIGEVMGDQKSTWSDVLGFLKDRWAAPHKAENEKLKLEIERLKLNGRTASPNLAQGSGSSGGYATLAEAQQAHARHEITNDQMRAERARFLGPR